MKVESVKRDLVSNRHDFIMYQLNKRNYSRALGYLDDNYGFSDILVDIKKINKILKEVTDDFTFNCVLTDWILVNILNTYNVETMLSRRLDSVLSFGKLSDWHKYNSLLPKDVLPRVAELTGNKGMRIHFLLNGVDSNITSKIIEFSLHSETIDILKASPRVYRKTKMKEG